MKILLTNEQAVSEKVIIRPTDELEAGKVRFSGDYEQTIVQVGQMANMDAEDEEDKFRRSIVNGLGYGFRVKTPNISVDLSAVTEDTSYVLNMVLDALEETSDTDAPADTTVAVRIPSVRDSGILARAKEAIQSKEVQKQAFGDEGDPLKGRFEAFSRSMGKKPLFREFLIDLIEARGITKYSRAYTASGVSKSTFSRITNYALNPPYQPSKDTVAAFAIGLALELDDAQKLYNTAGYYLGETDLVDRVMRFFIHERIFSIFEVNYCLLYYHHLPLGERIRGEKYDFQVK